MELVLPVLPINLFLHDIRNPFDFADGFFNIIVSDLSLHYFDSDTTAFIISELMRLLDPGGHLILRVNRAGDDHYGYDAGEMIEPDFFQVGEISKRFFRIETIEAFFSKWNQINLKETSTFKYGSEKKTIVGLFQKTHRQNL